MARADWLAASGSADGLKQAVALEPSDERWLAAAALIRNESGDLSPEVDRDLERASRMNPLDVQVLMAMGLRAEFRGDRALAEKYLVRAADKDRQFKPAWSLASFYFRQDQFEKAWPMVKRALDLNPLAFDPQPIFDLCWNAGADSKKILSAIPDNAERPIQYLSYLMETNRAGPALEAWPLALSAGSANKENTSILTAFPAFLDKKERVAEAVAAWNELVKSGVLQSGTLNPATGISIADPMFRSVSQPAIFDWLPADVSGVTVTDLAPSLQFEFDGKEPEEVRLVSTIAPVAPGRSYRLVWKLDSTRLSSPQDPGFIFRIGSTECSALSGDSPCVFAALPGVRQVTVELLYRRANGTTRAKGVLVVLKAALEFGA